MEFKDIVNGLDKLSEKELVSILILLDQKLDLKTPSDRAVYNKEIGIKPRTRKGVIDSPKYKKFELGGRLLTCNGVIEDNFPF